jgi:hypothetical protein
LDNELKSGTQASCLQTLLKAVSKGLDFLSSATATNRRLKNVSKIDYFRKILGIGRAALRKYLTLKIGKI